MRLGARKRRSVVEEYYNQVILFGGEAWRRIDVIKYLTKIGIKDGTPAYFRYMEAEILETETRT
jgi:hypothetical protein